MDSILLIDGDIIRYRCAFAAQHTYYDVMEEDDEWGIPFMLAHCENYEEYKTWCRENYVEFVRGHPKLKLPRYLDKEEVAEPVENALHIVKTLLEGFQHRFTSSQTEVSCKMRIFSSCPTPENWRTSIYPEYKATRPERRAIHDEKVNEYLLSHWGQEGSTGWEADDLISMNAFQLRDEGTPYIIISIDKDLHQIPGTHYDWVKEELFEVDEATADSVLEEQIVSGDATDNIKGIPGFGIKLAKEWCTTHSAWEAYEVMYKNPIEANYQYSLNRALVELPMNEKDVGETLWALKNEKKDFEETKNYSSEDEFGLIMPRVRKKDIPVLKERVEERKAARGDNR